MAEWWWNNVEDLYVCTWIWSNRCAVGISSGVGMESTNTWRTISSKPWHSASITSVFAWPNKKGPYKKKTSLSLTFTNHVFSVYQSIPFQRYQHLDHHCEGRKEHRPAWAPHGSCCHVALRRSVFVAGNLGKARDAELFRCWASESMQCLFMFRK